MTSLLPAGASSEAGAGHPEAPVRSGRHANPGLVLAFLSLAGLAFAVLQSLVAPALPVIARDLGASTADISWVLTAYLLAASVTTPIAGRLGDMFGKRRLMLVVLVLLAAGSLVCALAGSLTVLVFGRALQGTAGAILPLSIGIVRDELPPHRVGVSIGLLSALFGIGGGLGIVLAGPIVDHLSWHWLFWFPLVVVAIAVAGVAFGVPESPTRTPGRVDYLGALLLSATLVCLLLAVSKGQAWGWDDGKTLGLFAGAVVAALAWVLAEVQVPEPLVDMRMMGVRGVWTTNVVGLAFGFAMFGSFLLVPQLLELPAATGYGFGKTVTQAGVFLLPTTVAMLVFGPLSGLLESRFGAKLPLVLGSAFAVLSFVVPAVGHAESWQLLTSLTLTGIGLGLAFAAMANAIVAAVPASQTGVATSINALVRTVGGSVGTAVLAVVLSTDPGPRGIPTDEAFTHGFWVSAGVSALALLASLALPGSPGRRRRDRDEVAAEEAPDEATRP